MFIFAQRVTVHSFKSQSPPPALSLLPVFHHYSQLSTTLARLSEATSSKHKCGVYCPSGLYEICPGALSSGCWGNDSFTNLCVFWLHNSITGYEFKLNCNITHLDITRIVLLRTSQVSWSVWYLWIWLSLLLWWNCSSSVRPTLA